MAGINKSIEMQLCLLVVTVITAYSVNYIFIESYGKTSGRNRMLAEGWSILSMKQDVADFEWFFWFSEARFLFVSILSGHVLVSIFAEYFFTKMKATFLCLYGIIVTFYLFGLVFVAWIVTMTLCCFYFARRLSTMGITFFSLGLLLAAQQLPQREYNFMLSKMDYSLLTKSVLTFAILRCCSFALECNRKWTTDSNTSILLLLQYNFYIPYFFFGPIMTYNSFSNQEQFTSSKLINFLRSDFRIAAYIIVVDFLRHFLYISSLPQDNDFMESAPFFVIGFLAFTNFYLDWVKITILYGVSSGIARQIDGFQEAPVCCKNAATLYTFADTYFDRGLQQFVCRYAYDVISKEHLYLFQEAVAGAVSFAIVVIVQGVEMQTCVWAFLNWFGLTLEFWIMKNKNKINKTIFALIFGLNYCAIVLFNIIAINGLHSFQLYFRRLFITDGVLGFLMTSLLGYCYVRLNTEVHERSRIKKE